MSHNFENAERIGYLIASFIKRTLTPLERRELDAWILESDENELLFDELTSEENIEKTLQWYASLNEGKAYQRVKKKDFIQTAKKGSNSAKFYYGGSFCAYHNWSSSLYSLAEECGYR